MTRWVGDQHLYCRSNKKAVSNYVIARGIRRKRQGTLAPMTNVKEHVVAFVGFRKKLVLKNPYDPLSQKRTVGERVLKSDHGCLT